MQADSIIENPQTEPAREKLHDLADKARNSESAQSFMEPGTKVKNKGGRPKGSTNKTKGDARDARDAGTGPQAGPGPSAGPQFKTGDVLKMPLHVLSKGAAGWAGHKNAEMKPEELEAAAQSLGMVIDRWMPNLIDKYGPEVMCLLIFSQWGIRVYAVRKTVEADKAAKMRNVTPGAETEKEPSFDPNSWVPPQKPEMPTN